MHHSSTVLPFLAQVFVAWPFEHDWQRPLTASAEGGAPLVLARVDKKKDIIFVIDLSLLESSPEGLTGDLDKVLLQTCGFLQRDYYYLKRSSH